MQLPKNYRLNRIGIPIISPVRPSEQFCLVFDGFRDSYRGIRYRYSTVPSRLKSSY